MTSLVVRNIRWEFGAQTPFQWNPANPLFGLSMNTLSFIAPPFERYIVAAVREAIPRIGDAVTREEADAFLRQEAQHAKAHRAHTTALTVQYPGLSEISRELDARWDALLEGESLEFHLAYIADIEATFTPLFTLFLNHRATLFDNGDTSVAPVFLWHFVEEIEHRCSAQIVYDAIVPNPWYRLRVAGKVFTHILESANVCARGFNRHVPKSVRLADAPEALSLSPASMLSRLRAPTEATVPPPFAAASLREKATMFYRLLRSQYPRHSQANETLPAFADQWLAGYREGRDVANWYAVLHHRDTETRRQSGSR